MKLIDKSAVVTEINRVLDSYDPNEITSGRYALVDLRKFLDTLEVIEVDFEKELEKYWHPFITTQDLIKKYVSDHAANRWLDASELEQLLNDFVLEYDIIKNREYEQQCKCKSK